MLGPRAGQPHLALGVNFVRLEEDDVHQGEDIRPRGWSSHEARWRLDGGRGRETMPASHVGEAGLCSVAVRRTYRSRSACRSMVRDGST